jgi:glucose-1-phosphate adenylyltransferase
VLSADAVYKLDYLDVVQAHLDHPGAVTMVTTQVPQEDASRYGVVQVGDGGRVSAYDYKPDEPQGGTVANEVFVLSPGEVLDRLDDLGEDVGEEGLQDLGTRLLPDLARDGEAWAYPLDGYWQDVGTVESYWQAHRDFLAEEPPIDLDDPEWPVHTRGGLHSAARILPGAQVDTSLVSGGTRIAGTVRGSVLSPGVVVEPGAVVTDSVLLPGVRVRAGAQVTRAVVDDTVVVGERARVGGAGGIALVGREAHVDADGVVEAGGRLPDPEQGR